MIKKRIFIVVLILIIPIVLSYQIELEQGWNLVSIPVEYSQVDLSSVLDSIKDKYEVVVTFNNDNYQIYYSDVFSNFNSLTHEQGFWILMNESSTLQIEGDYPDFAVIELSAGWNLIGYPKEKNMTAEEFKNIIGEDLLSIFQYKGSEFYYYIPSFPYSTLNTIEKNYGYWININDSFQLTLYNRNILTVCSTGCNFTNIQNAVDSSNPGDTIIIKNGTYEITGQFAADLGGKTNIKLKGESSDGVVINCDPDYSGITIKNASKITIESLTIKNCWHGIYINNSENISVIDINSFENLNNGLFSAYSNNLRITKCNFNKNIDDGLDIRNVHDSEIRYSIFKGNNDTGAFIHTSDNLSIVKSNFTNNYHGLDSNYITNSLMFGLVFRDNIYYGGFLDDSRDVTFEYGMAINNSIGFRTTHTNYCMINNSIFSNNTGSDGLLIYQSRNNTIAHNIAEYNNYTGIRVFNDNPRGLNNTLINNSADNNGKCDISWTNEGAGDTCIDYSEMDLIPPAPITDFTVRPGDDTRRLIFTFTSPGDDNYTGNVSGYYIRENSIPINDSNFNTSQANGHFIDVAEPGENFTHIDTQCNIGEVKWFAALAYDDVGLTSGVSNTQYAICPEYNLTVENPECYKGNYTCNGTPSSLHPNTIYFYDNLTVNGTITNRGNLNENVSLRLEANYGGIVDSKVEEYIINISEYISGIEFNATAEIINPENFNITNVPNNYLRLYVKNQNHYLGWFRVWPLNYYTNLSWFSEDNYPLINNINSNEYFWVIGRINNSNQFLENYYDIPVRIDINFSFSINYSPTFSKFNCNPSNHNKSCLIDVSFGGTSNPMWYLNPLPSGTYNLTVTIGNPGDEKTIDRTINVVDA